MARKHMGKFPEELLQAVDAEAAQLGQTRVMYVSRALEQCLANPAPLAVTYVGDPMYHPDFSRDVVERGPQGLKAVGNPDWVDDEKGRAYLDAILGDEDSILGDEDEE